MITRQVTFWFSVPLLSLVFPAEALQEFVGVFTERSSVLFPALTESDRCQKEFYVFFSTSGVWFFFSPLLSKDDTFQLQRGKEWDYLITVWSKFFNLLSSSCWGVHPHFSSRETDQIELVMTLIFYFFLFGTCYFHMTYQGWDSNFDMIELHFIYSTVSCVLCSEHLDPERSR